VHRSLLLFIALAASTMLAACATTAPPASVAATLPAPATAGPASPSAVTPATPAPSVAATATTGPEGSPEVGGWRPVPTQDSVASTQFQQVVWTGQRFVAIGMAESGVFLDSTDGLTWHRQTVDPSWSPMTLNRLDDGVLVANGTAGERAASWQSADGLTWAVTTGPTSIPGVDVAMNGGAWVSVGALWNDEPCVGYCEPLRGLAWTSSDGTHWARAPRQATLEDAQLTSVARFGALWVAGGTRKDTPAVWSSPDGFRWTRSSSPVFAAGNDGSIGGVAGLAALGATLVAVGTDSGQDAARARAWWSTDGRTWHAAKVAHDGDSQLFHVSATGGELLATGPSSGCPGGIWASADGRSWACAADGARIGLFGAYDSAGSTTIEVAAGLTNEGYDENGGEGLPGAVWWRQQPTPVP
jgi:hypothetical protein